MASHLDAFSIRVRKRATQEMRRLSNFDGSGSDFITFFERFLSGLDVTTSHDQRFRGLLTVEGRSVDLNRRTITGTFLAGHYGRISRFVDINTSDNVFARKRHHAEAISFYFKAFLPQNQDEGIILIQRTGGASPFRAFKYFLLNLFRVNHRGIILELNALVNREELDAMLRRGVTEHVRISDFHLHSRVEEIQDRGFHQEVAASLVIKQRANEERNRLRDIVLSLAGTRRTGIAEIDEHIDTDSKIKISIEEGGQKHLVDLNSPKIRLSVEIDEAPETDLTAYREYLEEEAGQFMSTVAAKIWGENSDVWQH